MTTISHDAAFRPDVTEVGLVDFGGTVRLNRAQLLELVDRARALKLRQPGFVRPPLTLVRADSADAGPVDLHHPIQVVADLLTMSEYSGLPFERLSLCQIGDVASDLGYSRLLAAAAVGMTVRTAAGGVHQALLSTDFVVVGPGGDLITTAGKTAWAPEELRSLHQEQSRNRLWVLDAVLADWVGHPDGA